MYDFLLLIDFKTKAFQFTHKCTIVKQIVFHVIKCIVRD